MYFSMHDERQVCSLEERDVDGAGIQAAKQFLGNENQSICGNDRARREREFLTR